MENVWNDFTNKKISVNLTQNNIQLICIYSLCLREVADGDLDGVFFDDDDGWFCV